MARRVALEHDHRADGLAGMHQFETLVDVFERKFVRNQIIDVDFFLHVPVDYLWHVSAAARAAKCRALPDASSHELKRPRGNLCSSRRDADDDRYAPALVAALQRLTHQLYIAYAFETVVSTAFGEIYQVRNQFAFSHVFRIHKVRHAELLGKRTAFRINVHPDNHIRAGHARALDNV